MPASGSRGATKGQAAWCCGLRSGPRRATTARPVFTIHVGTADTSEASAEIAVVQLRVDDYYYLYGASVPRYEAIDAALR